MLCGLNFSLKNVDYNFDGEGEEEGSGPSAVCWVSL